MTASTCCSHHLRSTSGVQQWDSTELFPVSYCGMQMVGVNSSTGMGRARGATVFLMHSGWVSKGRWHARGSWKKVTGPYGKKVKQGPLPPSPPPPALKSPSSCCHRPNMLRICLYMNL
jgi:hypothetical protein